MKALILVLALLGASTSFAREGHEGPEAAPKLPAPIVAKLVQSAIFVPPNSPTMRSVVIRADGVVEKIENYPSGKETRTAVAQLDSRVMKRISLAVDAVKESALIDPTPADPGCMDAPMTRSFAVQSAKEIVIAQNHACKDFEKLDETEADRTVIDALKAVQSLSHLAR